MMKSKVHKLLKRLILHDKGDQSKLQNKVLSPHATEYACGWRSCSGHHTKIDQTELTKNKIQIRTGGPEGNQKLETKKHESKVQLKIAARILDLTGLTTEVVELSCIGQRGAAREQSP